MMSQDSCKSWPGSTTTVSFTDSRIMGGAGGGRKRGGVGVRDRVHKCEVFFYCFLPLLYTDENTSVGEKSTCFFFWVVLSFPTFCTRSKKHPARRRSTDIVKLSNLLSSNLFGSDTDTKTYQLPCQHPRISLVQFSLSGWKWKQSL